MYRDDILRQRRALIGGAAAPWWETDPNLRAWYPFKVDLDDDSGNGFNGSQVGDAAVGGSPAVLELDGTDDCVSIPAVFGGTPSAFSICMWVKVALNNQDYRFFGYAGDGIYAMMLTNQGSGQIDAFVRDAGGNKTRSRTATLTDWNFVVLTAEANGLMSLYLNGAAATTLPITSFATLTGDQYIGASRVGTVELNGSIGETFIYDRLIDSTEQGEIYDGTKAYYGL